MMKLFSPKIEKMPICTPLFHNLLSSNPEKWRKDLGLTKITIQKLLSGEGSIQEETATKIAQKVNAKMKIEWALEDLFEVENLKGAEPKREKVTYEYGAAPPSDMEKAGIIRYLLEGKFFG